VGHFAIQIAKARGAVVTATCSPANAALAKKLGADDTMGYSVEELTQCDRTFDAIFDAAGKMHFKNITRLLKKKGTYATTMVKPLLSLTSASAQLLYGRKLTSSNLRALPEDIEEMEKLFSEKKLTPVIENYFTLDKAAEAFEMAEHGNPRGKIIVRI
jgi:NADPH:quinone reductase-like Zn-dependent oxidoreductase